MVTRFLSMAIAALCLNGLANADFPPLPDLSDYAEEIAGWEEDIAKLEALDQESADHPGAVLLIGSSSIRKWTTAAEDLTPHAVIRRGYGGAKYSDVAYYAKRLITPHRFKAVVVFVGNDIRGLDDDKQPAEVGELFAYVADVIHAHQPQAQIVCVDVRPCPSRFKAWDQIKAANAAQRAACDERPFAHYLDTSPAYLTTDGTAAREDLYGKDRLHLSPAGYRLWSSQIKAKLDEVLAEQ